MLAEEGWTGGRHDSGSDPARLVRDQLREACGLGPIDCFVSRSEQIASDVVSWSARPLVESGLPASHGSLSVVSET